MHRDVKPANLLLDERGRLAVGDFGIATVATEASLTQTGQVLGTAAYISPEQARGHAATDASDRYALAVVAFELLTGRRPFTADHPAAQARAHVEDSVPSASAAGTGLPPRVDRVLAAGMAKDPAQRPATAADFLDALEDALDGEPAPAGPPTAVDRAASPPRHAAPAAPARPASLAARAHGAAGPALAALAAARARGRRGHRDRRRDRRQGRRRRATTAQAREHARAQRSESTSKPKTQATQPQATTQAQQTTTQPQTQTTQPDADAAPPARRPSPTTRSRSTTRASRSSARASRPTPSRRCSARSRPSAPRTARATSATPTRSTTSATPCA